MSETALVTGLMIIGYLIPEFCTSIGGGGARFPLATNFVSGLGFALIGVYIAV